MGRVIVPHIVEKSQMQDPMILYNRSRTRVIDDLVKELGERVVLVDDITKTLEAESIIACTGKHCASISLVQTERKYSAGGETTFGDLVADNFATKSLEGKLIVDCRYGR